MAMFHQVRRITNELEVVFTSAAIHELEENVCTMESFQRDYVSEHCGVVPYRTAQDDLTEQRRHRYVWPTWRVAPRAGVHLEEREGYVNLKVLPKQRMPRSAWVKRGWRGPRELGSFPTVTRPCPVKTPRHRTPVVDKASPFALRAWKADWHRRPPISITRGGG